MCGRYALTSPPAVIAERFHLLWTPELAPHYNIAPGQAIPVVRETGQGRELAFLRWGLIPSWAKEASIGMKLINARGETLADKPAFRSAYHQRRCLFPADAFYEWKAVGGHKQPYCIRMRDGGPFGMAGLWEPLERPEGPDGGKLHHRHRRRQRPDCTIAQLHERMPLIVAPDDYVAWLRAEPKELPHAVAAEAMRYHAVSTLVSNARNDVPARLDPIDDA